MPPSAATTAEYSPGRLLEIVGRPDRGIVLLWHGMSVDHRSCLVPLARRVADDGLMVLVVDWNPTAADRGRGDLLGSLRHARELAEQHGLSPDSLVVAGWSLGGTAAASLAVHAKRLGIGLGGVVLIAPAGGDDVVDPISGSPLPRPLPPGAGRCRVDVVYGTDDTVTPPDSVGGLELRLRSSGWATSLHAVEADHGGVVGARYDARTERYLPSSAPAASAAMQQVADVVTAAVSG